MARKTKEALIDEARELDLDVDEDENYSVIYDRVTAAREAQAREADDEIEAPGEPDVVEVADEDDSEGQRVCANCGRPAVTTDDAGGRANPVDFCAAHAP